MSQEFQQHWLSAYLDDELSSDERALVERRLEEDVEARQLLDDLRRVRGLVATLPGWQGSTLPFDMSRLAGDDKFENDDVGDNEVTRNSDEPVDESASAQESPWIRSDTKRSGSTAFAQWRGVLALAAGLLLMILCIPFFWRANDPIAYDAGAPAAGGMGGGLGGASAIEQTDRYSEPTSAAPIDAAPIDAAPMNAAPMNAPMAPGNPPGPRMPPASATSSEVDARGGPPISDPASAPVPPPPANVRSSTFAENAPQVAGFGANADFSREGASAKQMPTPAAAPATTEHPKDQPALKLDSALTNAFRCARSDAWTEAEVDQALPQLRTLVDSSLAIDNTARLQSLENVAEPQALKAKSDVNTQAQVAQEANQPATRERAAAENELLITDVPKQTDGNALFAQIQNTQPLVELRIAQLGRAAGLLDTVNGDKALQPPAQQSPARGNDSAAKTEALGTPEAKVKLNEKSARAGQERIVLFVTESEAKKILSNVLGSPNGNYWRVVPTESAPVAGDGQKKVIVILNHSR